MVAGAGAGAWAGAAKQQWRGAAGVFVVPEGALAGAGALTRRESRILASESRGILRPRSFALLGRPRDRSVEWCRAVLGRLIEEAQWAPETDWVSGASVALRFRRRENLGWTVLVAERFGVDVREVNCPHPPAPAQARRLRPRAPNVEGATPNSLLKAAVKAAGVA